MNLFLRSITIAVLVACCVQITSPKTQPVRASKKDPNDTRKVTVTITAENGFKKSSTFTKDTTGFAGKLYFDFDKGPNKITAHYKDEPVSKVFEKIVTTRDEAPENSEIVIDTINGEHVLYIDPSKAKPKTPAQTTDKKVSLWIEVPDNTGSWELFTGPTNLTVNNARTKNIGEVLLEPLKAENRQILVYEDKPTKIYVENKSLGIAKLSTLRESAIKKARDPKGEKSRPMIVIDRTGHAKIMSVTEYEGHVVV